MATELGVSRQELQFRVKFVEIYPTEGELSNAVRQFGSWHQIVAKGLTRQARPTDLFPGCPVPPEPKEWLYERSNSPPNGADMDIELA